MVDYFILLLFHFLKKSLHVFSVKTAKVQTVAVEADTVNWLPTVSDIVAKPLWAPASSFYWRTAAALMSAAEPLSVSQHSPDLWSFHIGTIFDHLLKLKAQAHKRRLKVTVTEQKVEVMLFSKVISHFNQLCTLSVAMAHTLMNSDLFCNKAIATCCWLAYVQEPTFTLKILILLCRE